MDIGPAIVPGGRRDPAVGAVDRAKGAMGGGEHAPGDTRVGYWLQIAGNPGKTGILETIYGGELSDCAFVNQINSVDSRNSRIPVNSGILIGAGPSAGRDDVWTDAYCRERNGNP